MIKNDRLLKALRSEPVDVTPVWIMRQAGRYLPEYRELRAQAKSFMTLCKTPELACEVTMQPLLRYPLDAAIIFSDILTIPDAMGLGLHFIEGKGPVFEHPLKSAQAIEQLRVPNEDQLAYVYNAIQLVTAELNARVPLIGFCGSPWTLAAYMVEGRSQPGFPALQAMRLNEPALLHKLLNILAKSVEAHLLCQIKAGAQAVMIFDTWGGILQGLHYQEFSLQYMNQIITGLNAYHYTNSKRPPIIVFTKGGHPFLEDISASGCDAVGVDWNISLGEARSRLKPKVALQGNLNPAHLLASEAVIYQEVEKVLASYGKGSGHVFNLGHGITPDVNPDKVAMLVDTVHTLSKPYHE